MFIDTVLEVIKDKNRISQPLGIDIIPIFPPRSIGCDSGDIVKRVLRVKDASIVFMNVTPISIDEDRPVLNSGVCIEFGILLGIDRLEKCHLFCLSEIDRGIISPIFHGRHIDSFSPDQPYVFKSILGAYIDTYLTKSTSEFEKYTRMSSRTR